MEEIKNKINSLPDLDTSTMENLFEEMKDVEKEQEKLELCELFIKRAKELLQSLSLEEKQLTEKLDTIYNLMENIGISERDRSRLFTEYQLDEDSILKSNEQNDNNDDNNDQDEEEIKSEKLEDRINNIHDLDTTAIESLIEEIAKIEKEEETLELCEKLINRIKEIMIDSSLEEIELKGKCLEINDLLEKHGMQTAEVIIMLEKNKFNEEDVLEERNSRKQNNDNNDGDNASKLEEEQTETREIDKINAKIAELESMLNTPENINIDEEIQRLESEKSTQTKKLNELIIELQKELTKRKKIENKTTEELKEELNNLQNEQQELWNIAMQTGEELSEKDQARYDELNELVKEVKQELEKREKTEGSPREEIEKELNQKRQELSELKKSSEAVLSAGGQLPSEVIDKYAELQKEIKKLEQELAERKKPENKTTEELEQELQGLLERQKTIQSTYDKKISSYQELKKLRRIRDIYNKIINEAIEHLGDDKSELELKEAIENFVNNHEQTSELDKYSDSEKLKNQLKEDIYNNLKKKKITKKENNKKILLKALAGVAGFVTGLGLSSVPGVSIISMTIAGTKMATSTINWWTKKNPTGKIATIKNTTIQKMTKYPKITSAIKFMKEKFNNPYINWFINGVSAGYMTGNIIELVSGKSIFEHLRGDQTTNIVENPTLQTENRVTETTTPSPETGIIEETTGNIGNDVISETTDALTEGAEIATEAMDYSNIMLNPGDVVDLSSISQGLVSSDSTKFVNLMQSVGKEVIFDRAVTLPDGRIMWHFQQINGMGYAWFDSQTVQEVLGKAFEASSKTL